MDESQIVVLLRETRDLIGGQERVLAQHLARVEESNERACVRAEQAYERHATWSSQEYREQLQAGRQQNRVWMFTNYLYLFVTVFVAATLGAKWGR